MHTPKSLSLLLPTLFLPAVSAWGTLGHQTVAYVASNFVSDETRQWAQGILSDTSDDYLAEVSTWADTYRYTSEGSFSAPFHFIDANDNPPHSCGVDYDRDCGAEGCVVSAIKNYTSRVQDGRLSEEHTKEALEFLVHFIGDIQQPLHDENLEVGGNDIDVTFNGEDTNLHHIWDTDMLEKLRGGYGLPKAQEWADELTDDIKDGKYADEKDEWLQGINLDDPIATGVAWASDANSEVCGTVLKDGVAAVEKGDLDGDYYEAAVPVFTVQIAKGGYRLAAWLNLIATGETGL